MKVGIPWRPGPGRQAHFEQTVEWWQRHGFEVLAGEDPRFAAGPFNLAAARNWLATQLADQPVLVLCDADTTPEFEPTMAAIYAAQEDGLVHLPYDRYRSLTEGGTFIPGALSGVLVVRPDVWEAVNGQDERFTGWGYEDTAWALAVTTLIGPLTHHRGIATAAAHPKAPRDQLGSNLLLYQGYVRAYGNEIKMRLLVAGEDRGFGARPYRSRPL